MCVLLLRDFLFIFDKDIISIYSPSRAKIAEVEWEKRARETVRKRLLGKKISGLHIDLGLVKRYRLLTS